jgi:hypothetical protein
MEDYELFTINEVCEVNIESTEINSSYSRERILNSLRLIKPEHEINLFEFLPEGWKVHAGLGDGNNPYEKLVEIGAVNKGFSWLPHKWILETLHEFGHAHNQYLYTYDPITSRDRVMQLEGYCKIEDVTDMLKDEMGAWEFALKIMDSLDVNPKFRTFAGKFITESYLAKYVGLILNPCGPEVEGMSRNDSKRIVASLYQNWLNFNVPKLKINFAETIG